VTAPFGIESFVVDGTDHAAVRGLVVPLADRLRAGGGPFCVEAPTSRWPGSYGLWPQQTGGPFRVEWIWDPGSAPREVAEWTREATPSSCWGLGC
jgi:hypothetical protein